MNDKNTKIFIPEIPVDWVDRVRSGHENIWNERSTDPARPETRLSPPANGLYAEKQADGWYWVNGCETCLTGVKKDSYIVCDEHNRCADCGTHHDQLTDTPYWSRRGFVCEPCNHKKRTRLRNMAIQRAKNVDHTENDCYQIDEIICPVCAEQIEHDEPVDEEDEHTCPVCDAVFTVELVTKYTTKLIRKEEIA